MNYLQVSGVGTCANIFQLLVMYTLFNSDHIVLVVISEHTALIRGGGRTSSPDFPLE